MGWEQASPTANHPQEMLYQLATFAEASGVVLDSLTSDDIQTRYCALPLSSRRFGKLGVPGQVAGRCVHSVI